jgi:hypothetical protein
LEQKTSKTIFVNIDGFITYMFEWITNLVQVAFIHFKIKCIDKNFPFVKSYGQSRN